LSIVSRAIGTNHFATVVDTVLLLKAPRGATPGVRSDPKHRQYPVVVDPVIGNVRLTKVLMDGGSSLNIIYAETLGLLRVDLSSVRAGAAPFHGIIPGKRVQPLG
jgi:hypothetical protein